ncbi:unnamed protein product [Blepharisma stoltei]|uniref:Uncharacterized protein n=1 Tax=Blepharisma stoltei TaxID=1481888 RepID=A0AAU9JLC4_9CILI|nr:unnamed protein product [Blepharisma stoltei]
MKSACCSFCPLDAIFISDCGNLKACPKHKAIGHKLKRIKIPIIEESKEIFLSFIGILKKKFRARFDDLIEKSTINKNNEKYQKKLRLVHNALHGCSIFVMHLLKKKSVEIKLILSPFEYFLTQPKEKAQQYIEKLGDQNSLSGLCRSVKTHLFDFNYFKFEDKKFIHGWVYKSSYNLHDHLLDFSFIVFLDFIKIAEYEMAYEWYQNFKSYLEFYGNSSINAKFISVLFDKLLKTKTDKKRRLLSARRTMKKITSSIINP